MSSLNMRDKRVLEEFLGMDSGYVLAFSDRSFGEFVQDEIHSDKYTVQGSSKAKKLRAFWEIESDYLVGRLIRALIDYSEETAHETTEKEKKQAQRCKEIASHLIAGGPSLDDFCKLAYT